MLNGIKAVLSDFIERKDGIFVNVSSIAGVKAFPNHAVYCATKFALHGFTETIRQETAKHGIRHCLICPGVVETELLSHTTNDAIKNGYTDWKKNMGKALEAEDIARAISFVINQPKHVCVREIVIGPTAQEP